MSLVLAALLLWAAPPDAGESPPAPSLEPVALPAGEPLAPEASVEPTEEIEPRPSTSSPASDGGAAAQPALPPPALGLALVAGHPSLTFAGVSLTLSGFAQVDGVVLSEASYDEVDASTGQPLNERAISLRRARLRLTASKWLFSVAAELEASTLHGLTVKPYAAELAVRWPVDGELPLARLSVGLLRIPFGHEVRALDALERFFLEPSTAAQALFPGHFDLGLKLSGGWRFLRYDVAVMNGEPVAETSPFPGKDPNAAKDVVGRLGAVAAPGPVTVAAGVSGLWGSGFHQGTPATKSSLVWVDANEDGLVQTSELQVVGGLPATVSASFERFGLGADLELTVAVPRLGALELDGEVTWAKDLDRALYVADPVALGRSRRELGWVVAVTQALPWGFALGARFDQYLPDADAVDQEGATLRPFDSRLSTWSVTAAWRWERTARLIAQYEHQTNALGRALTGAPTTLGRERFTLRAEVAF